MRVNEEREEELPKAQCQRMLSLVAAPLLPPHQLEAIFAAYDTNLDGEISPDELRGVLCMINPLGRSKEIQALLPKPPPPGLAQRVGELTAEEVLTVTVTRTRTLTLTRTRARARTRTRTLTLTLALTLSLTLP